MAKIPKKAAPAKPKQISSSPVRIILEIVIRNESSSAIAPAKAGVITEALMAADTSLADGSDLSYTVTGKGVTLISLMVGTFHEPSPSSSGKFHLADIPITGKVRVSATAVKGTPTGNGGLSIDSNGKNLLNKDFDFQDGKAQITQLIQL